MSSNIPYQDFNRQYIAGKWRSGKSEKVLHDTNPYTSETLVEISLANKADMEEAMLAAKDAQPGWAVTPAHERAAIILRVADILINRKDEISSWLVKEGGSTLLKADIEWMSARSMILETASYPSRLHGRLLAPDTSDKESRIYRKPLGVVGVISPWNFPLHLSMRSVAPALALGNAVVLKPASDTPVSGGLLLAKIFEEAGLPPGLLSVLVGAGSEIGDAFVQHEIPRFISFTGSTSVGKRIGALVAEGPILKRMALELGGNTPFVVLDDASVDDAVQAAIFGKFLHQGQICMAINRIIVDASVYDEFVTKFTERASALPCGNPAKPGTVIGPIINAQQCESIKAVIAEARKDGAKEMLSGKIEGLVVPPHVFADVNPNSSLAKNEIFGPVACIIKAENENHALELANSTNFGLSSCVFTKNLERGARFAQKVETGMTHVNGTSVADIVNAPFGGEKNSGIGRFNGEWILEELTTLHWVTVQHTTHPYPF